MKVFVVVLLIVGLLSSFAFAAQSDVVAATNQATGVSKNQSGSSLSDFWGTLQKNPVKYLMPIESFAMATGFVSGAFVYDVLGAKSLGSSLEMFGVIVGSFFMVQIFLGIPHYILGSVSK